MQGSKRYDANPSPASPASFLAIFQGKTGGKIGDALESPASPASPDGGVASQTVTLGDGLVTLGDAQAGPVSPQKVAFFREKQGVGDAGDASDALAAICINLGETKTDVWPTGTLIEYRRLWAKGWSDGSAEWKPAKLWRPLRVIPIGRGWRTKSGFVVRKVE